jgi:hypothetical protein
MVGNVGGAANLIFMPGDEDAVLGQDKIRLDEIP